MGDLDYPKRQLRSFQVKAEDAAIHDGTKTMPVWSWKHKDNTDKEDMVVTFDSKEVGDLVITFDSRKLLVSEELYSDIKIMEVWQ